MPGFVIALAIIVAALWFFRSLGRMKSDQTRAFTRKISSYVLIGLSGLFALRGNFAFAAPLFAIGSALFGSSKFFPNGFSWVQPQQAQATEKPNATSTGAMTISEALQVLGLKPGADESAIRIAHKKLLKDFHPDAGGTDYLAAKINLAKDLLLKR
jgi:hypothetical protein